jgi:hypothetical protein
MPVSDAIKIAQESLNEIETRGITNPEVKGILNEYIEKLTLVKTSPIMDQFGRPIQQINREAASSVPYSELAGIRTDVLSKLSNAGKSQGNFSQSDLAAIIFDSKVSGALSDALPGLKSLRGEYADFKKIATEAYKIVRPKTGEYNTRAIERLLSRHASGKTSAGEQELIKAIEKGTDLLPGSGKFYASSEAVGKELEILKNQNPIKLSQIKKQSEKLVDTLIKKKNLAQSEKRELQRAWVRAKVAGSLIGSGGAIAAYRAVT